MHHQNPGFTQVRFRWLVNLHGSANLIAGLKGLRSCWRRVMDLNKALVVSDSSNPSSLLMELPHGWDLPCQARGLLWGQWAWGSVPHLPYRIHLSFLCLPETPYGFQPRVLGWLEPCGSPCIVLHLLHTISTANWTLSVCFPSISDGITTSHNGPLWFMSEHLFDMLCKEKVLHALSAVNFSEQSCLRTQKSRHVQ